MHHPHQQKRVRTISKTLSQTIIETVWAVAVYGRVNHSQMVASTLNPYHHSNSSIQLWKPPVIDTSCLRLGRALAAAAKVQWKNKSLHLWLTGWAYLDRAWVLTALTARAFGVLGEKVGNEETIQEMLEINGEWDMNENHVITFP